MMPPTFSHRLSRPSRQAAHLPQVMAPYITTLSPGLKRSTPAPTCSNFAGGFRADHQRQLPLGEGHAAKAPEVEVIERDRLDAHLHLAVAGRRRIGHVGEFELAVGDQAECAHGVFLVLVIPGRDGSRERGPMTGSASE